MNLRLCCKRNFLKGDLTMKNKLPGWLVLCIIALAAGALLTLAFQFTAQKIDEQTLAEADTARRNVLPAAQTFQQLEVAEGATVSNCYAGLSGSDTIGHTAQITVKGYGGEIEIIVGVDMDGKLAGVWVGGDKFSETAGLGAKTREPAFTEQFIKLAPPVELKKDIDAVSGATISSSAVTSGVNKAAEYILNEIMGQNSGTQGPEDKMFGGILPGATTKQEESAPEGVDAIWSSDAGCVVYASAKGYGGMIQVQLGVANDGTIAGIRIGEEGFQETAGLGERVTEDAFLKQFIGLSGEVTLGSNVDAVSGATISSKGVVDAANIALTAARQYLDPSKTPAPSGGETENTLLPGATNLQEQAAPEGADALWTADEGCIVQVTVKGYGGPIEVKVGVLKDGAVAGMEVGGAAFAETPGLGEGVKDEAFWSQFIGKTGSFEINSNVDAISGATISSTAVVKAVNAALAIAAGV